MTSITALMQREGLTFRQLVRSVALLQRIPASFDHSVWVYP
jgi:hypothetical protein